MREKRKWEWGVGGLSVRARAEKVRLDKARTGVAGARMGHGLFVSWVEKNGSIEGSREGVHDRRGHLRVGVGGVVAVGCRKGGWSGGGSPAVTHRL